MASDSETFLRIFDSHSEDGGVAPDPVVAAETIDQFVNLLRSQYITSGFLIRKNTYMKKIWDWLSDSKVLQVGSAVFALDAPDNADRIRVVARVASVAEACLRYIRSEFPQSAPQCLAGAFVLPPPRNANARVRLLARHLKWEQEQENALVAEFNDAGEQAAAHKEKWASTDLDAWTTVVEPGVPKRCKWTTLGEMILFLHSLLITETQCERDFAKDVHSTSALRNRLTPMHRWCNMKIMARLSFF